jgi:hypothetical protein
MPTKTEWIGVHADLMAKMGLPCRLRFSLIGIGRHGIEDDGSCWIAINPDADFRVPAHLILHEAAHHRCICYKEWECGDPHCEHWARVLCDMYRETGVALPQVTSFFEFAKAAGIVRKNFAMEGGDA